MKKKPAPKGNEHKQKVETPATPFLRWVGGKRLLVSRLKPLLPHDFSGRHYHEPFVGAASMFFAIRPQKATLSDLNRHLIDCYRKVRDEHGKVSRRLSQHVKKNSKRYYNRVRNLYNRSRTSAAQAARFIFLNSTGFNGVFRVNTEGAYNVPYGDKENPKFPTTKALGSISKALNHASLHARDFEKALKWVKKGHFVYLDPPYPPLNGTAYFTHYTADRFNEANQKRLAKVVKRIDRRGGLFMMTNADLPGVRTLYEGFRFVKLSVTRYVSCKGTRHKVGELVILNYKPSTRK